MPFISSTYQPPSFWAKSGHLQTIYRATFRQIPLPKFKRERIITSDNDFFDVDWSRVGGEKLVVIGHGLEGDTTSNYLTALVYEANRRGWDAVGMNYRGCSGEPNLQARFYHSGATGDVHTLISHIIELDTYKEIAIVGYSLGGNMMCKYSGEREDHFPQIKAIVGVSVPCDLAGSSVDIGKWYNTIYLRRFMKSLKAKVQQKSEVLEKVINVEAALKANDFFEFDDACTGPVHGFAGAADYYSQCSSLKFLPHVSLPTLVINAIDDSFLSQNCYPEDLARNHPHFWLETPKYGGHVAFYDRQSNGAYWIERRIMDFIETDFLKIR